MLPADCEVDMTEESPLAIPRNPAQIPASQFRLSRNLKVRGDAIYIIFGGIIGAVFLSLLSPQRAFVGPENPACPADP